MIDMVIDLLGSLKHRAEARRLRRRWQKLRAAGMRIGVGVWLPGSTWIDSEYAYLIDIGDHCGFGEECMILAHDAQMDEFLDATRLGRVVIHASSHIGARTTILPGVEIGPRTIVGANSLVSRSLPPNTVCAGNPARVLCSLDDYLARHARQLEEANIFPVGALRDRASSPARQATILAATMKGRTYTVGGHSEENSGGGTTPRTSQPA